MRARDLYEIPQPGHFAGAYLAEVESLADPESLSRVKVRLLSFDGVTDHDGPIWARVAAPFAGANRGAYLLPDVGDEVLVVFLQGDSRLPIIVGGLWNGSSKPPGSIAGGQHLQKVIRSKNGVKITLDDTQGQEQLILETPGKQKITLKDGPGSITIEDSNQNSVKLEASGITVTAAATVTVNAAQVKVSAGMVTVDTALAKFSGVVKCETLIATSVISTSYTPGAGEHLVKPKHSIILRGYGAASLRDTDAQPVIVRRTEGDFVTAILEGLRAQQSRDALGAIPATERVAGRPHLRQPIHRTFNLVVLEALCDRPGRPRLDPSDVESAGFVVRRVVQSATPALDEAWQHRGETILGWGPLAYSTETPWPDAPAGRRAPQQLDPDPIRRQGRPLTAPLGVHLKLSEIRRRVEPPAEHVVPLFVAPPDVCQAAGRTLFYGVVPTSSSEERTERAAETVDAAVVDTLLPGFLRAGSGQYHPRPGFSTMNGADAAAVDPSSAGGTFGEFILGLRTLHGVWHAFDSAEGAGLLIALNQLHVEFDAPNPATQPLGDYLAQAADKLLIRVKSGGTLRIPNRWPYPTAAEAQSIRAAATTALNAAHAKHPPAIKRFDEPGALYRIHAFVRVRCDDGCPPEIHWALPSEPFSIAAWWESGGPIHTVALPDVDEESVKKLRPNVAFTLPPKLANLINRSDPKKLSEGDASLSGNPSLGWICSFSLPIITLCAFIVLNIFLGLFHLIFQWLFYIKICLPFPKFSSPPKP